MLDISVALLFIGIVALPAYLGVMPRNESAEETANSGKSLSPALARAKQGSAVATPAVTSRG